MSYRGRLILMASLAAGDALGVLLGLGLAYQLVIQPGWPAPNYLTAAGLGLLPWLMSFATLRLYDLDTVLEDSQEYATVATGCTYGILLLIVLSALIGESGLALAWLLGGWALSIVGVGLGRFLMRRVVRAMRRRGHLMASALIVGADEQGRAIARQLKSEVDSGLRVMGFVDDFLPLGTPVQDELRVLGHPSDLPTLAADQHIAEIIVVPGAMAWESFHQVLEQMATSDGPRIRLSPGYYDLLATTPRVAHRNFVPLIVVDSARLSGVDALMKLALDYGAGLALTLLTLPINLLIALTGARLETQTYLGIGGRTVRAQIFCATPGGWLARSGLYRLPLLWAVLLGHLSLIGPRPISVNDSNTYRRWMASLTSVKPGLSGPWAVVPVAGLEEEMRAATYYIRNWTIWLDLQMLIQTALVVLRRRWGTLE